MIEPWRAIFDEYPSGALEFGVIRGEDRSTFVVLSYIFADDFERLNSNREFEQRIAEAQEEAKFRNAMDEADAIATATNPGNRK